MLTIATSQAVEDMVISIELTMASLTYVVISIMNTAPVKGLTWKERFYFYKLKGKATCICNAQVCEKEYNMGRHYATKHKDKYDHFTEARTRKKISFTFTKTRIAQIAAAAKPYSEGGFVRKCRSIGREEFVELYAGADWPSDVQGICPVGR